MPSGKKRENAFFLPRRTCEWLATIVFWSGSWYKRSCGFIYGTSKYTHTMTARKAKHDDTKMEVQQKMEVAKDLFQHFQCCFGRAFLNFRKCCPNERTEQIRSHRILLNIANSVVITRKMYQS